MSNDQQQQVESSTLTSSSSSSSSSLSSFQSRTTINSLVSVQHGDHSMEKLILQHAQGQAEAEVKTEQNRK